MKGSEPLTFGLIAGNRDVFPRELARKGKAVVSGILKEGGYGIVTVSESDTPDGVVETLEDAEKCASVFRQNAARIDGIVISLPNFGDERSIADAVKRSGLDVPIYVHAFADHLGELSASKRRDSFCGKLSVCNNLAQYGIRYSVGRDHVVDPASPRFSEELHWFAAVCRIVRGMKNARIGSLGARTTQFKTVRFSEKLLEAGGISVETKSLMETVNQVRSLADQDGRVKDKLQALLRYAPNSKQAPAQSLLESAKLAVVLEEWVAECRLDAFALQCWPALQDAVNIFPCTVMSMMSNELLPSACEMDVAGAAAMYALQLSGGTPSALFDWNNNYGEDPNRLILFHCSNCPLSLMKTAETGYNVIAAKFRNVNETYCTLHGKLKAGKLTFARFTTDDVNGRILSCIGDGEVTEDDVDTFGTTGVLRVDNLPKLLYFLASHGFEHHVAVNYGADSAAVYEALSRYLGWKVYYHNGENRVHRYVW